MKIDYRILEGDVTKRLRDLPGRSVDCVVTSPPYWGLRDYGIEGQIGLEATPAEYIAKMVDVFREIRRVMRMDATCWLNMGDTYASSASGDAQDRRGYRGERLVNGRGDQPAVLRQKTRATRDGTHCGLNKGMAAMIPMNQPNRLALPGLKPKDLCGIPWRLAFALQDDGWWLRQDIIWNKTNPMPESIKDRCTKSHEYIFLLTRSRHYHFDAEAIKEPVTGGNKGKRDTGVGWGRLSELKPSNSRHGRGRIKQNGTFPEAISQLVEKRNKRSVWTVATQAFSEAHFATFPEKLIIPCILAGCPPGGVVLDPFNGAGTTGIVALQHHRKYIGIDISPEYVAMTERRLNKRFGAPVVLEGVTA